MKNKITVTLSQESFMAILECVRSDIKDLSHDIDRFNESTPSELDSSPWISRDFENANKKLPSLVNAELELYGFGG